MRDRLHKTVNDLLEKWQNLERQQKIRLTLGIVVLVFAIGVTLFFTLRPEWSVLLNNKDAAILSEVKVVLSEAGITSKYTDNNTSISVRKSDELEAVALLKNNPQIGKEVMFQYSDYFSQAGVGVSESVKKSMEKLALSNNIAATIKGMNGVVDAKVLLNIPESTGLFIKDIDTASAYINITQSSEMDKDKVQAVVDAAVGAVRGLDRKNVTVTNQYMDMLYQGGTEGTNGLTADYDIEIIRKNEIDSRIRIGLWPIFDETSIVSHIVVKTDQVQREDTIYSSSGDENNTGVVSRESTLNETAIDTTLVGEPGVGANDQTTANYATGEDNTGSSATRKTKDTTYDVNRSTSVVKEGYGQLIPELSSVSVIGYKFRTYNETYMTQNNLLPVGMSWVQFKEQQTALMPVPMNIDANITANLINGTGIESFSIIGYELYYFEDAIPTPLDWQQIVVFAILALLILIMAYGLIRRTQPEEVITVDPELSVEDLLVSTQLEDAKEIEAEKLKDIDYTIDSEVKKQIDKFVDEKPEAVAQLLRNWLTEGWE